MPRNVSKATVIRRVIQYHQNRNRLSTALHTSGFVVHTEPQTLHSSLFANESVQMHAVESGAMSDSSSCSHPVVNKELFDLVFCVGDDRTDEFAFEYLSRLEVEGNNPSSPTAEEMAEIEAATSPSSPQPAAHMRRLSGHSNILRHPRVYLTCTVGNKSTAAKWFIGSHTDVLKGLDLLR
jgi:trehalose-6-phosphatase